MAQTIGDYRSVSSGDWANLTSWQRYNGTAWNTPTALQGYPGQFAGTNAVTILAGHIVTISSSGTINSPLNGTMASLIINGSLTIFNDVDTNFNTYLFIVSPGSGQINFNVKGSITLPNNATLIVTHGPPEGITGQSNNTTITIGSTTYHYNGNPKISQLLDQGGANYITFSLSPTSSCGPGSFTITATANPSAGAILNWYTVPSLGTIISSGSTYNTPVLSTTTTYYVEAVYAAYTTPRLAVTALVSSELPNTTGVISGITIQCPNLTNQIYSVLPDPNVSSYNWTIPTGWTITAGFTTNTITVTTGANGQNGDITVSAINGCGTSQSSILPVSVSSAHAMPVATAGSSATCSQITANWNSSAYATGYYLDVSTVNDFASYIVGYNNLDVFNVTSFTISGLSTGTTYYYRIRAYNSCGTSSSSVPVSYSTLPAAPGQPGVISGLVNQCPGSINQIYSVADVLNATSYTWSIPSGWTLTGGGSTRSITVTTGLSGQNGNISVTANNVCGLSNPRTLAVTVSSVLSISTQPNDQTDCYYNLVNFTAATSGGTGTVSYQWQINNSSGTFVDIVPDAYVLNPTLSNLRIEHIGVGNYQDQTIYRLKATDACSTIYSNP
ncbi:MAG: fibronectin type III domain-containing protein, partial [Prolixibacteraceae bacterium]